MRNLTVITRSSSTYQSIPMLCPIFLHIYWSILNQPHNISIHHKIHPQPSQSSTNQTSNKSNLNIFNYLYFILGAVHQQFKRSLITHLTNSFRPALRQNWQTNNPNIPQRVRVQVPSLHRRKRPINRHNHHKRASDN